MKHIRIIFPCCLFIFTDIPLVPGSPSSPVPVNVLLHNPITLECIQNRTLSITSISWKIGKNGKRALLLDSTEKPYRIYPSQFRDRLKVSNDLLTLTISDMRMEDSGRFYAEIAYEDGDEVVWEFNVTVYEPVLAPSIEIKQRTQNSEWCNVTLRCSVPTNSSSLSYSWRYRDGDNQQYNHTGDTIHIPLRSHSHSEVLCIVQNPVDMKNAAMWKTCNDLESDAKGESSKRTHVITIIVIVLLLAAVIGALALFTARKWKRRKDPPSEDEKKEQREPQYIQVTASRSGSDNQVWNNSLYDASPGQKTKAKTIYAEIKHKKGTQR